MLQGNIGGHVVLQQAVKSIQIRRRGSNVVQRRSINTKGQVLIGQHPRMLLKKTAAVAGEFCLAPLPKSSAQPRSRRGDRHPRCGFATAQPPAASPGK